MSTNLDEVIDFLRIANEKGFLNNNTAGARRTACTKFFEILDEDQKNVEYVQDNLEVIKARFSNLNKEVAGRTVEEYGRRVQLVLNDFTEWKADRAGWERKVSEKRNARPSGDTERKSRTKKAGKAKPESHGNGAGHTGQNEYGPTPETRVVSFPIRPDFDLKVTLPKTGITVAELRKLAFFLLPYANDWEPTESPRVIFPMLERGDEDHT